MTKIIKRLNIAVFSSVVAATSILSASSVLAFEPPRGGAQQAENSFARLDVDLDGVISLNEMTDPVAERAASMLSRKDADQDSLLTIEEMQKRRRGNAIDLTLIAEEIVQCVSEVKEATANDAIEVPSVDDFKTSEEKFTLADTSADGFIDLSELESIMLTKANNRFTAMDSDDDGMITNEEYLAHVESRQATKEAIRGCVKDIQDSDDII